MGLYFFDQYSILHLATGIIAYFWHISLVNWFLLHLSFEIVENTGAGIYIINKYITYWPGGKPKNDSIINSFGDNFFALLGWITAYYLDILGQRNNWYGY